MHSLVLNFRIIVLVETSLKNILILEKIVFALNFTSTLFFLNLLLKLKFLIIEKILLN